MILAFASLVVVLLLQSYVDLRVKRDSIPTGDWVGIIAAAIACLVLLWGLLSSLVRVFNRGILTDVVRSTMAVTSMVFVILVGAAVFSLVFRGLGGEEMVHELLTNMPGGLNGAIIIVMVVMFILGFFLDFIEITLVVVPMVAPALLQSDLSPVWLGVMMAMNLQTSFLTPPFGFALFYLRGVAPTSVETMAIYRGAIPFVIIQLFGLVLLSVFPSLATWLPNLIFG
jgi:TRAP-type mannitol/chloroaromatic compound transport system permease large subunit